MFKKLSESGSSLPKFPETFNVLMGFMNLPEAHHIQKPKHLYDYGTLSKGRLVTIWINMIILQYIV